MKQIRISDVTMKQALSLSFREKIEMSKLLDKLGVDLIELEPITQPKIDSLRIKSVAGAVKHSAIAVPVALNPESVAMTWNALKEAKRARLQVCAPVSPVQMEYLLHKTHSRWRICRMYPPPEHPTRPFLPSSRMG